MLIDEDARRGASPDIEQPNAAPSACWAGIFDDIDKPYTYLRARQVLVYGRRARAAPRVTGFGQPACCAREMPLGYQATHRQAEPSPARGRAARAAIMDTSHQPRAEAGHFALTRKILWAFSLIIIIILSFTPDARRRRCRTMPHTWATTRRRHAQHTMSLRSFFRRAADRNYANSLAMPGKMLLSSARYDYTAAPAPHAARLT